ncbi:MAG: nucleotidyltransferase domain-containing protein [Lachnospiraceae bacterium]|nr:nucleotidyltransferase domain-containing protein [Lachnospiraceae bacterium]
MTITADSELFQKLIPAVCKIYGDNLISIILYGSVARNTATEESDIDIALLVRNNDKAMYEKWLDVAVNLDLEYDQLISTSLIEVQKFNKWKKVMPYYINIEKEGIVLWKAA